MNETRPTAAQVMRQAIAEERRKHKRVQWWLAFAAHAVGFVIMAALVVAVAIK